MFYLNVTFRGGKYWLHTERQQNQPIIGKLSRSILAAEAFKPSHVEHYRQQALEVWPGCTVEPVECSSQKLIPENMRKVLNLA